jgi:hypothetical protein
MEKRGCDCEPRRAEPGKHSTGLADQQNDYRCVVFAHLVVRFGFGLFVLFLFRWVIVRRRVGAWAAGGVGSGMMRRRSVRGGPGRARRFAFAFAFFRPFGTLFVGAGFVAAGAFAVALFLCLLAGLAGGFQCRALLFVTYQKEIEQIFRGSRQFDHFARFGHYFRAE